MKNVLKKRLKVGGAIVAVAVVGFTMFSATNSLMKSNKIKKSISEVEKLISEGHYKESKDMLSELKDKYKNDTVELYNNIVEDYLVYDGTTIPLVDNKNYLEHYIELYKENLGKYPFEKLGEDVNKLLEYINANIEKFNNLKDEAHRLLSEDNIEGAKEILEQIRNEYSKEIYDDLEKAIAEKETELAEKARIAEEEKEAAQKEEEQRLANSNSDNTNSNTTGNSNNSNSNSSNSSNSNSNSSNSNNVTPAPVPASPTPQKPTPSIATTKAAQNSSQLITVVGKGGSYAELKLWQKDGNGNWSTHATYDARLGRNGLTDNKREGDGCTPTGIYGLSEAFGIKGNPGTSLSYRVLDGSEYWVDDSNSQYYNTMQFGASNGRWNSAEHLSSIGTAYNYSIVVDYNRWSPTPGKGSAIFLHVGTGRGTSGCVSISESGMIDTLNWINSGSNPKIIITSSYDNLYKYY